MRKLDVLPHRARIRVALAAAGEFAGVGFAGDVSFHVFGAIAGVVEAFIAALVVTDVRFLPRVGPDVQLQIFQPGEATTAAADFALVGLFTRVAAEVGDELVSCVEGFLSSGAVFPLAHILRHREGVPPVQMRNQVTEAGKFQAAVVPQTHLQFIVVVVLELVGSVCDGRQQVLGEDDARGECEGAVGVQHDIQTRRGTGEICWRDYGRGEGKGLHFVLRAILC